MAKRSRKRRRGNRKNRGGNTVLETCPEDYMMPGSIHHQQLPPGPPLSEDMYHGAYVVAPQAVCSQVLYHPASNYYGYYPTVSPACFGHLPMAGRTRSRKRRRRNRKRRGSNTVIEICPEDNMMPGTGHYQQLLQPPEDMYHRPSEVASQVVCSQDPYHLDTNYYGYYSSGFQPQNEWYGPQSSFGANNQTYNYSAMQAGTCPYAYYPQSYCGYGQPYYNYDNPYINGGFVYVGGSMPQYFSYPQYQQPVQQYQQPFQPAFSPAPNFLMQPSGVAAPGAPAWLPVSRGEFSG